VLQWPAVDITSAYRVGSKGDGHDALYKFQITKTCGRAAARASVGVDLSNPLGDASTSSRASVVVAPVASDWQVWARFYY
jgi:hypothetical protein